MRLIIEIISIRIVPSIDQVVIDFKSVVLDADCRLSVEAIIVQSKRRCLVAGHWQSHKLAELSPIGHLLIDARADQRIVPAERHAVTSADIRVEKLLLANVKESVAVINAHAVCHSRTNIGITVGAKYVADERDTLL